MVELLVQEHVARVGTRDEGEGRIEGKGRDACSRTVLVEEVQKLRLCLAGNGGDLASIARRTRGWNPGYRRWACHWLHRRRDWASRSLLSGRGS